MNNIARFTGKIYPDKTFSIGFCPRQKKKQVEKDYDKAYNDQFDSYSEIVNSRFGENERVTRKFQIPLQAESRFIKSSESSQKKSKGSKKYGQKGITRYGKKSVTNIALLLQKKYGRKRIGFGTATLPQLDFECLKTIQSNWGDVVRRFFQSMKRALKKRGVEFDYCGVTEIQERRYKKSGLMVLHLHWAYLSRGKNSKFYIEACEIRKLWYRTIARVLALHKRSLDLPLEAFKASIDCQVVKKSCSAYLGKYLSKGAKVVSEISEDLKEQLPSQWWFASMQCKKMLKDAIIRMDAKTSEAFFYGIEHYLHEGVVIFARFIEVERKELSGEYIKVGLIGALSQEAYNILSN